MKTKVQRLTAILLASAASVACLSALPAYAENTPQLTAEEIEILNNAGVTNEMIAQILAPPSRSWTGHDHFAQFQFTHTQHYQDITRVVRVSSAAYYDNCVMGTATMSSFSAPPAVIDPLNPGKKKYTVSYSGSTVGYNFAIKSIMELNSGYSESGFNGYYDVLTDTILMGDPNQTGTLDIYDLLMVAQQAAGTISLTGYQLYATDINCDGNTTDADTAILSNYLARNIEYFWS